MSMSLDRLFFFWRKGDSLLIEKREQDLFERMKNGEFAEGTLSLRAKIDMASPFMVMRDPVTIFASMCLESDIGW